MAKPSRPRTKSTPGVRKRQAVLYARVSSKEQEKEGFSIPAQLKLLREYARKSSLTLLREFVDVETAKRAGRTSFGEMVEFLEGNPNCRVLLVEKTDRLYRNLKDWVTLDELDSEIHFVKENAVYSGDSRSSEKLMHGIRVLMAKNYIDNLSEEVSKGMLEKADQGLWPSYAPFGYCNTLGVDGKKVIGPDPDVAPAVTRLFELYATGNCSLKQLAGKAQGAGLISRKSRRQLPKSVIHQILQNPIYYGDFMWKGRTYKGKHVPLISRELWDRVQEMLQERLGSRRRGKRHDFAFSGLIKCGHCGCSLVGQIQKGRYVYYHCSGYKGKCRERYTREEVLEECFGDLLKKLHMDDEVLEWVTDALRQSHVDEKRHHDEAIARLQTQYKRLQERIDSMYVDKLDGRIDDVFFDRMAPQWRGDQDRVLRDIEKHQTANEAYIEEGVQILELAGHAHELFQKQEPREKRRLLSFLLSNCTWKGGRLHAEFRQPFDMLAVTATRHQQQKAAGTLPDDLSENWLPRADSNHHTHTDEATLTSPALQKAD